MATNQNEQQKPIVGILVSLIAPFENHIANGGEKLLGNASSIKRRPDGKVYISGQMQRHVFFSALKRLNDIEKKSFKRNSEDKQFDITQTFVSNADGITNDITHDLRADLGGYMHTNDGENSERRTGALSVTVAVAKDESKVKNDLLNRVAINPKSDPALATKEFSQHDDMIMNFYLDLNTLSITEHPNYKPNEDSKDGKNNKKDKKSKEDKKSPKDNDRKGGWNVGIDYIDHVKNVAERKRRARLFLQATSLMNDYANQARNAVCGEPEKVVVVFDTIASRKASRYLMASEMAKKNIKEELEARGAKIIIGDDETEESVHKAYEEALKYLESHELYSPATDNTEQCIKQ